MKKYITTTLLVTLISSASFSVLANDLQLENNPQNRANSRIIQAIQHAENYTGSYAIDAEESRTDKNIYVVEIANEDGSILQNTVDLYQQRVVDSREIYVSPKDKNAYLYWHVSIVNDWNIKLQTALQRAERQTGMDAVRADFDLASGRDYYEIDLTDASGRKLEVHINAENDYGH